MRSHPPPVSNAISGPNASGGSTAASVASMSTRSALGDRRSRPSHYGVHLGDLDLDLLRLGRLIVPAACEPKDANKEENQVNIHGVVSFRPICRVRNRYERALVHNLIRVSQFTVLAVARDCLFL